jgi:hypothetical protein
MNFNDNWFSGNPNCPHLGWGSQIPKQILEEAERYVKANPPASYAQFFNFFLETARQRFIQFVDDGQG